MTVYLSFEIILAINEDITGNRAIRDVGVIQSAAGRPSATAFGHDAYPTVWEKAAALLQSIACNHGFVDGNKRTAWLAAMAFLEVNGHPSDPAPGQAAVVDLMLAVAQGRLSDIPSIASELVKFTR